MCGIVGFIGKKQAAPILLDGLSKLEYRGFVLFWLTIRNGDDLTMTVSVKNDTDITFGTRISDMRFDDYGEL